jgi:phage head maturation protease
MVSALCSLQNHWSRFQKAAQPGAFRRVVRSAKIEALSQA